MKDICVFTGGGIRGMFQIGAYEYLLKQDSYTPKIFAGSSIGAINAAFIAAGYYDLLKEIWFSTADNATLYFPSDFLNRKAHPSVSKKGFWRILKHIFGKEKVPGLVTPAIKELLQYVTLNNLKDNGKELLINFTDLHTAKTLSYTAADFPTDETLQDAILSSASFPGVFPARQVTTYTKHYSAAVDAGIGRGGIVGAAVDYAKQQEEEVRFTIIATFAPDNPGLKSNYSAIESNILRSLEIALHSIASYEIGLFEERNRIGPPRYKRFSYRIIQPDPADLAGYMDFSYKTLERQYLAGRNQASSTPWIVL